MIFLDIERAYRLDIRFTDTADFLFDKRRQFAIQHFVLRWFLRGAGAMPWNYVRFLDYAADHLLLRKVGGGYIFIHRLLMEYFASLPLPQSLVNVEQAQQTASAQEEPASPADGAES